MDRTIARQGISPPKRVLHARPAGPVATATTPKLWIRLVRPIAALPLTAFVSLTWRLMWAARWMDGDRVD